MKKILATLVVLFAVSMSAMATFPTWLEAYGPGYTQTTGQYSTSSAFVEMDKFTPQDLVSTFRLDSNGISGVVDQETKTSITGTPTGVQRQYLTQSATLGAATSNPLGIDAENNAEATPLVMGITKAQTADFSGMLTGPGTMVRVYDVNGDRINDDPYSGGHILDLYSGPSWTADFSDTASVTAKDADGDAITLHESVKDATATVSSSSLDPIFQIDPHTANYPPGTTCEGQGQWWTGYATLVNGQYPPANQQTTEHQISAPDLSDAMGTLIETSAGMTSDAGLAQEQVMKNGVITSQTLASGDASLSAGFTNALLDGTNAVSMSFNTGSNPFKVWWTQP